MEHPWPILSPIATGEEGSPKRLALSQFKVLNRRLTRERTLGVIWQEFHFIVSILPYLAWRSIIRWLRRKQ